MPNMRTVFLVSDGTGITIESMAHSLLSQFPDLNFCYQSHPYIDTPEKMQFVAQKIQETYAQSQMQPLVFVTMVKTHMINQFHQLPAHVFDFFTPMVDELESILKVKALDAIGRAHGFNSPKRYDQRIDAINYALACDDGLGNKDYDNADVILVGVSRCGKTPSCLYMALQFGIYAANYPITEESIDAYQLPQVLKPFKHKLFGLTISPKRLHQIRQERKPHSRYASLEQCQYEIKSVESLFKSQNIPYLDSTCYSIEEISTRILSQQGIERRL